MFCNDLRQEIFLFPRKTIDFFLVTECSKVVLGVQEDKAAVESSGSAVEDIDSMVKGSNGHLYAFRDSIPDRETFA